jgi:hypothetical protein
MCPEILYKDNAPSLTLNKYIAGLFEFLILSILSTYKIGFTQVP